jgi:hypothetical protein
VFLKVGLAACLCISSVFIYVSVLVVVVKIQQSGLPIRKPHDAFIARFKCLAPSNVRFGFKTPLQLIQCLKQLNFDLPNIQPGKKLTFYKGYEERILEGRRTTLLNQSSTVVQAFWRCRIRTYLFRSMQAKLKSIAVEISRYNLEAAKTHCAGLKPLTEYLNKISDNSGIVDHVYASAVTKIQYLEDQLKAVKQARDLMTLNTMSSLDELSLLVPTWDRLNISDHETIIKCTKLIADYDHAKRFLAGFCSESDNSSSVSDTDSSVENLTIADMAAGIAVLRSFQNILPRSKECIQAAEIRKEAIKREIEELTAKVVGCLRAENVVVDDFGNISFGSAKRDNKLSLEGVVSSTNLSTLFSKDARMLFSDCAKILTIRNEYIPANRLEDILSIAETVESKEFILTEQFNQLSVWAKARLMSQSVVDCLKVGQIQFGDLGVDFEVEVLEIAQQSNQLKQYQQLSVFVLNIYNASRCIAQVFCSCRLCFNALTYAFMSASRITA